MSTTQSLDLRRVQLIRKAVLLIGILAVIALAAISQSLGGETELHEGLETVGIAAIVVCIVGRAWCSLYIGGRKKAEIVDRGPYSLSRNPLYVFSFLGAFGMGAQTGSLTIAALFVLIAVLVFAATVKREEAWLSEAFGPNYAAYVARTPRFWPDFTKWRDREVIEVRPRFFLTTLRDGLVMLIAFPLFEGVEHFQHIGWIRVLLNLP
ncbi:isoprenylcysteine carboxylmethyltransferase family protein [Brevundimonas sp. AJA228-03]|uniref:methyltransferase family protein n=1 Tax=Brevundimonas sp. AJA228-03 TaxID=2752515 RepID=UPI001ADF056C|nr:isoprenylcysteine carboxylmethyltransferase family protein [Brevundimonas sp. AJA228-03]QTN20851.1 isoprenylcysteine carboxylmethyltransferase family protein [Brevundimonas sp. AJA228-03]